MRRTPWFHVSQNFVMPTSKPTPNANAPAKTEVTYTPEKAGQSGMAVASGVVAEIASLNTDCYA